MPQIVRHLLSSACAEVSKAIFFMTFSVEGAVEGASTVVVSAQLSSAHDIVHFQLDILQHS